MNWDQYFMSMAYLVATKSKDRSTQVGCVVVGPDQEVRSTGFNGFARGVDDNVDARHERPDKYLWTSHAEENAVAHAARTGAALKGCTAYVTHPPCARCTRSLIQAGVKSVIVGDGMMKGDFTRELEVSSEMAGEAGVQMRQHGGRYAY